MAELRDPDTTAARTGPPEWARELLAAAVATAVAVIAVAAVAASPRSELLFRDADSLVTTLVVHSLAVGQPQDWAMSSVLFVTELAVLWLLSLLGLGVDGTLALAGVVNLVALYGALRVAAGRLGRGMPRAGALLALGVFALLAASEWSPSRDALELASLLTTTTYYSATVVAAVLAVGLARRALDRAAGPPGPSGVTKRRNPGFEAAVRDTRRPESAVPWGFVAGLAVVAAASVVSNPLFAAWAVVPLGAVLLVAARRERVALWLAGALVAGTAAGFAGRMPLSALIANTGAGYIDVSQWVASLGYYGGLLVERWNASWGAASVVTIAVLMGWSLAATVVLAARRDVGAAVVAACGWVMPVLVVAGAIALGTHAARYVQPAVFAPLLGLVVLPSVLPLRRGAVRAGWVLAASAVLVALAAGVGIPRIVTAANAPEADLDCVVDWVEASGRTGAGQFWTVRLPKTHLADPRALVQVDHRLNGYAWLVNRDDFAVGEVSFLVLDEQSPGFELPAGRTLADADLVPCGRYTIADFGADLLPLGPQRS